MSESIGNLFNTGKISQRRLYEQSAGISDMSYDIIKRAIVIDVNRNISKNSLYNFRKPPYSIKAAIIGEDSQSYGVDPKLGLYNWYKPLMSSHNISIPEIGEEILVIRENTSINASGYWIGRINDSSLVSRYLTREYSSSDSSVKYGFDFDVKSLNESNSKIQPQRQVKNYILPAFLGDVITQGRSGTYVRHSFDPNNNTKIGVLEMGLMEDRLYKNSDNIATIGKTRTKTVHMRGKLKDIGSIEKKTTTITKRIGPFPDGSFQNIPVNINASSKNFIANIAEEFYHISNSRNAEPFLYKQVLGEKLEDYQKSLNEKINNLIDTIDEFVNTTSEFLEEFLNHNHVLPEINIQLPDKEVSFTESVRQPSRLVPTGESVINIKGERVERIINTPVGPKKEVSFIGGQTIKVKNPPRLINGKLRTVTKKKTIKFDAITIGGEGNKRVTTSPTTTKRTQFISDNISELFIKFRDTSNQILLLTDETRKFLSNTNFIN